MIHLEQAQEIVRAEARRLGTERVALADAPGHVLAEEIVSDTDMPPFDKSAVDGYACRQEDLAKDLHVVETISAGLEPSRQIGPGECAKIMTGAHLPLGADVVVMVENAEEYVAGTIRFHGDTRAKNICFRGEDLREGQVILSPGILIKPQHVAVLAAAGATNPLVSVSPRVAVLSTGDELVPPSGKPDGAKIRDSNSWQIAAQVAAAGGIPHHMGIVPDSPALIRGRLEEAMASADVVLMTGGVSMGDYDYVPGIMKEAGIRILFRTIAIQPGKPTVFGRKNNTFVFGLPGNPVSCFVLFEVLVKPLLQAMVGWSGSLPDLPLPMGAQYFRKKSERKALVPVCIRDGQVFPVVYHGSAHIHAYTEADGIITLEIGETEIKKGDIVHVRPV